MEWYEYVVFIGSAVISLAAALFAANMAQRARDDARKANHSFHAARDIGDQVERDVAEVTRRAASVDKHISTGQKRLSDTTDTFIRQIEAAALKASAPTEDVVIDGTLPSHLLADMPLRVATDNMPEHTFDAMNDPITAMEPMPESAYPEGAVELPTITARIGSPVPAGALSADPPVDPEAVKRATKNQRRREQRQRSKPTVNPTTKPTS